MRTQPTAPPRSLVTVVGARPQFVKAAVVSRALALDGDLREVIVHTGQHFDARMSASFFDELAIPTPRYNLGVHSLPHGAMTGRMLEKLEAVLVAERPDAVLVYGDTDSTLAGALAACKLHVPVVHVEAGLRSFNRRMPEELNRVLTDRVSALLCCPTRQAVDNLYAEGFARMPCRVVETGDVMFDAALHHGREAERRSPLVDRLALRERPFALATLHRAENTDDPARLAAIADALGEVARRMTVILPLHPRTAAALARLEIPLEVTVIDPVGYLDMLALLRRAQVVLTDSGGVQKEAFFFARPCVTLRDETEWVELVAGGFNRLAGADSRAIVAAVEEALASRPDWGARLYGDGHAGEAIVAEVRRMLDA
jgi:UDP-GlcNAc3NAcA epimerase